MPDVVHVHQVTDMLQRVGRAAGDQSLHRDELGYFQIDAGGALRGDRANHVALGEHADRGIAFGANHVLDHERADIAGAHQLGGDTHGLVHANRDYAGGCLLAQDVSDLHGNLLRVSCWVKYFWYTLYQLSTSLYVRETFRVIDLGPSAARSMLPSGFPALGTPAFSITAANCLGAGLPFPRHFFVNLDGRHRVIAENFELKVRFLDNRRSELPVLVRTNAVKRP